MASGAALDKKVILLKPRGFCAGVVRAIDVVKIALDLYGSPRTHHNTSVRPKVRQVTGLDLL
jgi:4-hydroxy-3-methylbut-2-enyl diphosphate reductase IspH